MASQSPDDLVTGAIKQFYAQRGQSALEGNSGVQASQKLFPDVTYTDAEQQEIHKELERASTVTGSGEGVEPDASKLKELNQYLSSRTVLLGAKPSIADVVLYSRLAPLVKSWSREQRTGKDGYHHIVRFVNFVQTSDRFELELEPSAKVDIDPSDIAFIPKPVDPKAEKERKKKEKEAQKKATATEKTKTTKEAQQPKEAPPTKGSATEATQVTKDTEQPKASPQPKAAATVAPALAATASPESKTDQPKSAAPAPTKSRVAAMAAKFENKAKEAAEEAKASAPIDLPKREKRTPSAEVPKAAPAEDNKSAPAEETKTAPVEEAKGMDPSPAAQPKTEKKEKKQKQPKQQKAPQGPPLSPALIDLRVGHILKAINHPNADSLYVSTIAVGDPPGTDNTEEYEGQVVRTVCSGLNGLIPLEEMQNRKIVAVCNLKPVTMRGIKSCAMVLAASPRVKEGEDSHGGPVELVLPPQDAEAGQRIWFEGWEGEPEGQLNPKKKIWEQCQVGFSTTDDLGVTFEKAQVEPLKDQEDKPAVSKLRVKGGDYCSVPSLKGATVR